MLLLKIQQRSLAAFPVFVEKNVTVQLGKDEILTAIEKAGMLPPEIKEKSWKIADNGEMIYSVNEWDEE